MKNIREERSGTATSFGRCKPLSSSATGIEVHPVALTVCMRKLLTILNAMVRQHAPWRLTTT